MSLIFRRLVNVASVPLVTMVFVLSGSLNTALAQSGKKDADVPTMSPWVLPYMFVILLIGIGLMAVCRPSRRRAEVDIKPDDDDDL